MREISPFLPARKPVANRAAIGARLVQNSFWNLFSYGAVLALGLASLPLYVHYMGLSTYGLFALLNSIVAPIGLINVSLGRATTKYIAQAIGAGKPEEAVDYLRTTLLFNTVIGVLGVATLIALTPVMTDHLLKLDSAERELAMKAMKWTAFNWFATQLSNTLAAVPMGFQLYRISSMAQCAITSCNLLAGLSTLMLGGNLVTVLQAKLACVCAGLVYWVTQCRALLPGAHLWPVYHGRAFRASFDFSLWQTLALAGGTLGNQADRWMLGATVSAAAVGAFNIPATINATSMTAINKLGDVLMPAISHMQGCGDETKLPDRVMRASALLNLLNISIQGTIFIFADDMLRLLVNAHLPAASGQVLRLFSLSGIINSASMGIDPFLLGTARTRFSALIALATGLVTFLLTMVFVPLYGLAGAAWSDLIAIILTRPLFHFILWQTVLRTNVTGKHFLAYLYGQPAIALALLPVGCLLRSSMLPSLHWVFLLLACGLSVVVLLGASILLDLLPGAAQRRNDTRSLLKLARQHLRIRSVNACCSQ